MSSERAKCPSSGMYLLLLHNMVLISAFLVSDLGSIGLVFCMVVCSS